jgi:hypothetical protein
MDNLFSLLVAQGVLHRDEVQPYERELKNLLYRGLVQRVPKNRRVYYQLTEKALPALELHRQGLVTELKKRSMLFPKNKAYKALLGDTRFLDGNHQVAKEFLFLGDWLLQRPLVPSQLKLSQERYYTALTFK